jgi:hypothetical protein
MNGKGELGGSCSSCCSSDGGVVVVVNGWGEEHKEATIRNEPVDITTTGSRPRAARPIARRGIGDEAGDAWRIQTRVKRMATEQTERMNKG